MLVYDNLFIINSIVNFIAKFALLTLRCKSAFLYLGGDSGPLSELTPLWLGRTIVSQPQLWERIILGWFLVNKVIGTNINGTGWFL